MMIVLVIEDVVEEDVEAVSEALKTMRKRVGAVKEVM